MLAYRRPRNPRAFRPLLGPSKILSAVFYPGSEVYGKTEIMKKVDI
jgi:hypothetical protein